MARKLAAAIPVESVTIIEHDSYYADQAHLPFEQRAALNFDHPEALESSLLVEHLKALRDGKPVSVPIYDFASHTRAHEVRLVRPTPIVVVEGILVFVEQALRDLFDLKLFVDTDADIRAFRRIRRDIEQRGRSFQSVRDQYYATVRPMHLQFVEPSKRWADIIIPEGGENHTALDLIVSGVRQILNGAA